MEMGTRVNLCESAEVNLSNDEAKTCYKIARCQSGSAQVLPAHLEVRI